MTAPNAHEERRERYVRAMGSDLGRVFASVQIDVMSVQVRWVLYSQLFRSSKERIVLLNETAGTFFGTLQRTMREDVLLSLARLIDRVDTGGKDNLSLRQLPLRVFCEGLRGDMESLLDRAEHVGEAVKDWRNRRLAHRDLLVSLGVSPNPLEGIGDEDVECLLGLIHELMNRVETHYTGASTGYEFVATAPLDADGLAYYMDLGLRTQEEYDRRMLAGEPWPRGLAPAQG